MVLPRKLHIWPRPLKEEHNKINKHLAFLPFFILPYHPPQPLSTFYPYPPSSCIIWLFKVLWRSGLFLMISVFVPQLGTRPSNNHVIQYQSTSPPLWLLFKFQLLHAHEANSLSTSIIYIFVDCLWMKKEWDVMIWVRVLGLWKKRQWILFAWELHEIVSNPKNKSTEHWLAVDKIVGCVSCGNTPPCCRSARHDDMPRKANLNNFADLGFTAMPRVPQKESLRPAVGCAKAAKFWCAEHVGRWYNSPCPLFLCLLSLAAEVVQTNFEEFCVVHCSGANGQIYPIVCFLHVGISRFEVSYP